MNITPTYTVRMQSKNNCPFCGLTDRQSNGQCRCRNVLYRAIHAVPGATEGEIAQGTKVYNDEVSAGATPDVARDIMRDLVPALAPIGRTKATPKPAHEAIEAPDGSWICRCGWSGKGTAPSVKSHVAKALKK